MSRLALLAALLVPAIAAAAPPASLPIQGYLTDDAGVPIDGAHDVRFRIYTSSSITTTEVDAEQSIDVDSGTFAAYIDVPHELYTANDQLYLGLAVDGGVEMTPRIRIATAPYAARAVYADECDLLEGFAASDFRQVTDAVDWTDLTSVPADLADGDANTTYTAGAGLTLTGTEFAADQTMIEGWARTALADTYLTNQTCTAGFVLAADGAGGWTCTDPATGAVSTLQSSVTTLQSSVTTLQSDVSTLQSSMSTTQSALATLQTSSATHQTRVAGACAAGESIRVINANGTVTCETDDVGPTYGAGAGITLTGTTFSANTAVVQARVSSSCAAGLAIRAINADGSVVCNNAAYTGSAGITLTGTNFTADTSVVQARVTGACPSGQYIRSIAASGAVTCESPIRNTSGTAQRICTGITPVSTSNWQPYGASGLYLDVDTSACGFTTTPTYISNLHGDSGNWATTGGDSAYGRTATGFRVYVKYADNGALVPSTATSNNWHVEWIAIGP